MARTYTNLIVELMQDGVLDSQWLVETMARELSEDDMERFYFKYISNDMVPSEEDEEEEV